MAKSYKLEDGNYIDSGSISHNRKKLKEVLGKVLYEDQTGSKNTIQLTESVAKFSYIEIYFAGVQGEAYYYDFNKIDNPNNKNINFITAISGSSNLYFVTAMGLISNNSISLSNNRRVYFAHNSSAIFGTEAQIYITKVIGYK